MNLFEYAWDSPTELIHRAKVSCPVVHRVAHRSWTRPWRHPSVTGVSPDVGDALTRDTEEVLDLREVHLTRTVREQVRQLRRVQWIRLPTEVTPADLVWIEELTQLRGLSLQGSHLEGADFSNLKRLRLPVARPVLYGRVRRGLCDVALPGQVAVALSGRSQFHRRARATSLPTSVACVERVGPDVCLGIRLGAKACVLSLRSRGPGPFSV